jgi:hypothetical protein
MYNLEYPTNANGVPVVSGDDLDTFGERLVSDFSLGALFSPSEIDIDRFATKYLKMGQDYFFLSHCGVYLGMTIFRDTNAIPIYLPEENKADYASAKSHTIIIDNNLLNGGQEHRYRFTVGHESSHGILHAPYFLNSIGNHLLSYINMSSFKTKESFDHSHFKKLNFRELLKIGCEQIIC